MRARHDSTKFNNEQIQGLQAWGRQAIAQMELRVNIAKLERSDSSGSGCADAAQKQ
jgi:hypothetical protein